ncbi:MAG: hypothetical protein KDD61_16240 [Bdellovibrionales bacterium]|nr:hypothetical protein [Bdellovibrionales bacterium]
MSDLEIDKIAKEWGLLILLSLLFSMKSYAYGVSAKLDFDFYNGYVQIEPMIPEVQKNGVMAGRQSCFGLCFGGIKSEPESRMTSEKNSYFFLSGNPDDLTFFVFNFTCRGPKLLVVSYAFHQFQVLKGQFIVEGTYASGPEVVSNVLNSLLPSLVERTPQKYLSTRTSHIHYFCSPEFRQQYQEFSIYDLARGFGPHFLVKYKKGVIHLAWDTSVWRDRQDQRISQTLEETRIKMAQYGLILPPVEDPFQRKPDPRFLHFFDDVSESQPQSGSLFPEEWGL